MGEIGVSVGQHYDNAAHVFAAVVTQVDNVRVPAELRREEGLRAQDWETATLLLQGSISVTSVFKGNPASLPGVYTHRHSATCGLPLPRAEEILFFADQRGVVTLCDGSLAMTGSKWRGIVGEIRNMNARAYCLSQRLLSSRMAKSESVPRAA